MSKNTGVKKGVPVSQGLVSPGIFLVSFMLNFNAIILVCWCRLTMSHNICIYEGFAQFGVNFRLFPLCRRLRVVAKGWTFRICSRK